MLSSFWKRFYTLSAHAYMNSMHAYFNISAREIGTKLKPHGSVCPPFWIVTVEWSGAQSCLFCWCHSFQIASFSSSTLENDVFKKHRFQIAPLWRAFLNGSIFGDCFWRCSVEDGRIWSETASFLFENWLVWTGPKESQLAGGRPVGFLCTSIAEKLNLGPPRVTSTSSQNKIWTCDLQISDQTFWPLGHTASIEFAGTYLYTRVERGSVRVSCQQHNSMTTTRASAWAQNAQSRD